MLEGSAAVAEARQAQAGMGSAARPQPLAPREADARDVAATLAGSADAFDALVKRHEKDVAVRMWRFSRESRVRGELVQDVFVEAYLSLRSYRPDRPFLHWLRKIATRVGYRHWEDQERRRRQLRASAAPPAPALEGAAPESARAAALLHALLARLGLEDRLVLTLMYFDDCGIREVAERTGWIRAAVAMRAHRARRRLRRIIERENLSEELQWLR
jgi:RNA polymerase sigma-70 factor (ECF subfamily)